MVQKGSEDDQTELLSLILTALYYVIVIVMLDIHKSMSF